MEEEWIRHNTVTVILGILMNERQPMSIQELVAKLGHVPNCAKSLRRITGRGIEGFPGITIFLWQYPSLFTIDDEGDGKVTVTSFCRSNTLDDFLTEAVKIKRAVSFYEFQLRRLGNLQAFQVPVKRIWDTRLQAANYIKVVSGKTVDELRRFLGQYEKVFRIVDDDYVVLVEHLMKAEANGLSVPRIDAPIILDEKVYENTRVIVNTYHGNEVIKEILQTCNLIAVDCEGVSLGSITGSITLVQIAYFPRDTAISYPKIYIFDIKSNNSLMHRCLKQLLVSKHVKKIFHGCEEDSYAFYKYYGIILENFVDTQVVHKILSNANPSTSENTAIAKKSNGNIGLNRLYEIYGGHCSGPNPLKAKIKKCYVGHSDFWAFRPLSREMTFYAAYDVYVLIGVYVKLLSVIDSISSEQKLEMHELNQQAAFSRIWDEQEKQQESESQSRATSSQDKQAAHYNADYYSANHGYSRRHPKSRQHYSRQYQYETNGYYNNSYAHPGYSNSHRYVHYNDQYSSQTNFNSSYKYNSYHRYSHPRASNAREHEQAPRSSEDTHNKLFNLSINNFPDLASAHNHSSSSYRNQWDSETNGQSCSGNKQGFHARQGKRNHSGSSSQQGKSRSYKQKS